jgi:ketosteroid isomerase-like protein
MTKLASSRDSSGRLWAAAVLCACLLTGLPTGTTAQTAPLAAADQELRAAESQLTAALSSVDVDQLGRIWADDFVSTMADGHVVSGKSRLAALRAKKPEAGKLVISSNEQVDVRAYGDWAVVLVRSSWIADGKRVGDPYQATHVWAKREGVWRLVAAHISQVTP